jgi:hypothetical protein
MEKAINWKQIPGITQRPNLLIGLFIFIFTLSLTKSTEKKKMKRRQKNDY